MGGAGGMGGATSSSSSAGGGMGGAGGGTPQCNKPSDCGQSTDCRTYICKMPAGTCEHMDQPDGTTTPNQTKNDCKKVVCDGMGGEKTVANPSDLPLDDGNDCTDDICNGDTPAHPDKAAGATCANGFCDGMGKCVGCTMDSQCKGLNAACVNGACVACDDGMKNGDETDVDCGGTHCKACTGVACTMATDCASGFCADGVCCNAACDTTCMACNLAMNLGTCANIPLNTEDTNPANACTTTKACDGAGMCKLKAGQTCATNADCLSAKCTGNPKVCQP
jgi:hypothetical protein